MSFNHIDFLLIFPLFFLTYWISPIRFRGIALLLFNLLFFATWGAKFFFVILTLSIFEWLWGKLILRSANNKYGIWIFLLGNFVLIATLVWFKYINHHGPTSFLPIGLSYQILLGISYFTDLRFKILRESSDFFKYLNYKTFFPQVMAGPISRYKDMEKHFKNETRLSDINWKAAIFLFSWGFFKKSYCGDYLVNEVITPLLNQESTYHFSSLILGIIIMPLQIYCDFSGYSLMAKGLAKSLGKDLPNNFNLPFLSNSFNEFWNRWHISLSQWLRDYIFFPCQKYFLKHLPSLFSMVMAIFVTWIIGGVWHGVGTIYFYYGLTQGLYVATNGMMDFYKIKIMRAENRKPIRKNFSFMKAIIVYLLFALSILLFLSDSLPNFFNYLKLLVTLNHGTNSLDWLHPMFIFTLIMIEHYWGYKEYEINFYRKPVFAQGIALGMIWIYIILVAPKNYVSFIYFKF